MSTPASDPDDPRLTAYALGESDPAEREAVERLLAESPEVRAEVEQTEAFVRALEAEYRRENDAYQDANRNGWLPGKIVAFPGTRRVGWTRAAAFAWKVAAVVVALGMLVHFAFRWSSAPQTATLAAARPAELAPPPAPVAQPSEEPMLTDSATASAKIAPDASGSPATENTDSLLAMDSDRVQRDDMAARPASQPAPPPFDSTPAAKPAVRREAEATATGTGRPNASAPAGGVGTTSPAERIGRSVVRIRTGDGSFIGGVLVTADGWILAAGTLPAAGTKFIVTLADRREISAAVARDGAGTGLCRFKVDLPASPAIALANSLPADKEMLTLASTDRHTGSTSFSRARAIVSGTEAHVQREDRLPAQDEANLVFNSNGELLAMMTVPTTAKAEIRAKSADRRTTRVELLVRPFSAAERALLQSTTNGSSR